MKLEVFKKGLSVILTVFPDKKIDSEVYWGFLKDIKDEDYLRAIAEIASTQTELYPGTNLIAMIREKALAENKLTAGEAWGQVMKEISHVGSWGRPNFDNPIVAQAVDCMGWRTLCLSENISVERAHFLKIYVTLEERNRYNQVVVGSDKKQISRSDKVNNLISNISKQKEAKYKRLATNKGA